MNDGEALLRLDDVHAHYGLSHVLQGVSLEVPAGAIVSLMGRNGVGKTTTLKSVFGLVPVRAGRIAFAGESLAGLRAYQIARRGIAMVPEDRRIFSSLSVAENILLAPADAATRSRKRSSGFRACGTTCGVQAISSPAGSSRCWPSHAHWLRARGSC